jgi:four helix bundle protein
MRQRPYEKLIVWKEAHLLCVRIYGATASFPSEERFGLTNQMRRSSYSVPMNIAEGNARRSKKDMARFIAIAIGSLKELHYQCCLACDLQYFSQVMLVQMDDHIQRIGYLLQKLRSSLL